MNWRGVVLPRRRGPVNWWYTGAAIGMGFVAGLAGLGLMVLSAGLWRTW